MITADKLKVMTSLTHHHLQDALSNKDSKKYRLTGSKFLGLTNAGEFCYTAVFPVEGGTDSAKVFIKFNPTNDRVIATIG